MSPVECAGVLAVRAVTHRQASDVFSSMSSSVSLAAFASATSDKGRKCSLQSSAGAISTMSVSTITKRVWLLSMSAGFATQIRIYRIVRVTSQPIREVLMYLVLLVIGETLEASEVFNDLLGNAVL